MSSAGRFRLPLALPRVERAEDDRAIAGVCVGIARAVDVDVTFVRLAFAFLAFASGAGIVAYVGAWSLLPAPGEPQPVRHRRIVGLVLIVWAATAGDSGSNRFGPDPKLGEDGAPAMA